MLTRIALLLIGALLLSGCMNGVLTGVQLVYDRPEITKALDNFHVQSRARNRLLPEIKRMRQAHIAISSFNNDLILTGQVPSLEDKTRLGDLVKETPGARRLFNELTIGPKVSMGQMLHDGWVTTQLKTKLLATRGVNHQQFKVITENGVVYLLGDVKLDEAEKVVDIARHIKGVKQVVRVLRYFHYQARTSTETG